MKPLIGVLALQGDFAEHAEMLTKCGGQVVQVRHSRQLAELDGLVIPGGESTTIAKLTGDTSTIRSSMRSRPEEQTACRYMEPAWAPYSWHAKLRVHRKVAWH